MAASARPCTTCPAVDEARNTPENDPAAARLAIPWSPGGETRGTYVLLLELASPARLVIGSLGTFALPAGWYAYAGSARGPGGLPARLRHHLRIAPRPHWHIDYLRAQSRLAEIWYRCGLEDREHQWARCLCAMAGTPPIVLGFGSSDCRCDTHLIAFPQSPGMGRFRRELANHTNRKAPRVHRLRLEAS
jgi:Uri superfamily endonuclease